MKTLAKQYFSLLIFHFFQFIFSDDIPSCSTHDWMSCTNANETCDETTHKCVCSRGFVRDSESICVRIDRSKSGNGGTIALVSLITITLLCGGLYLVIRRYRIVDYVRHRINFRQTSEVVYEDVMIENRNYVSSVPT